MMAKRLFLIPLIVIGINGGLCSEEKLEKALIRATCYLECPDTRCLTNCIQTPKNITDLDVDANANATFVCRDVTYIVWDHNPGIFVVESRSENGNWTNAVVNNGTKVKMNTLLSQTAYQFRFHRVFPNGISKPEVTEFISTLLDTDIPTEVTNIVIGDFEADPSNPLLMKLELNFNPTDDHICYYEIMCVDDINRMTFGNLVETLAFNTTFENLEFGRQYMISVTAQTYRKLNSRPTTDTFFAPTCLQFYRNLTICEPAKVEGIEAIMDSKGGNIFDMNVTWARPELAPDYYMVYISLSLDDPMTSIFRNVSGTETDAVFYDLKIWEPFQVIIGAVSSGGAGPLAREIFAIPPMNVSATSDLFRETPVASNSSTIITTSLASVVLLVGIVAYIYARHAKRKRNKDRSKYSKVTVASCTDNVDCKKDAIQETMKDIKDSKQMGIGIKKLLPPGDKFEVSPDRLEIKQILGTGAFGVVKLGSLRDDCGQVTAVAVKMLRDDPNEEDLRGFEIEIRMMMSAGQHPNIVSLLGCCTIGTRPLLIVEYCSRGDLQSFLRKILQNATSSVTETNRRGEVIQKNCREDSAESLSNSQDDGHVRSFVTNRAYDMDQAIRCDDDIVTITDLLNFGRQIATGMEFLSSNRVVHRDLAARNVLVCNDRTVKISDFGLSRDIYQENIYKKQGSGRLPVKWMAIEALTHQVYSTHSDVWSFGILLWEIVTLGSSPYPDIPTNQVLRRLQSGYRMERPASCSILLYNVMLSCWQKKPRDRPTFTVLRQELDRLLCIAAKNEYLDLTNVSETAPNDDEPFQNSNSSYAYFPVKPKYVNDLEIQIVNKHQD